jgi:hypothetical protein
LRLASPTRRRREARKKHGGSGEEDGRKRKGSAGGGRRRAHGELVQLPGSPARLAPVLGLFKPRFMPLEGSRLGLGFPPSPCICSAWEIGPRARGPANWVPPPPRCHQGAVALRMSSHPVGMQLPCQCPPSESLPCSCREAMLLIRPDAPPYCGRRIHCCLARVSISALDASAAFFPVAVEAQWEIFIVVLPGGRVVPGCDERLR